MGLKGYVKRTLRSMGWQVSKVGSNLSAFDPGAFLQRHRFDVLLDVGANSGQFARKVRDSGFDRRIVSFEPLPEAHQQLEQAARQDPTWTVYQRCALGSQIGEANLYIAANSVSSSLQPMLETHHQAAPQAAIVGQTPTPIVTLDSIFDQVCNPDDRVFLKIDTQGHERQVLEGAQQSLNRIQGVQLELSTVPLYQSQDLYTYFIPWLTEQGFGLWALAPEFYHPSGRLLQFDGVFMRENS
jgi:FkbM family methyltransferase